MTSATPLASARAQIMAGLALDPGLVPLTVAALDFAASATAVALARAERQHGLRRRDDALRTAATLLPTGSRAAQVAELRARQLRYMASGWLRDRLSATCPARLAGTVEGWLWLALKSSPTMPTGKRQLTTILFGK